MTKTKAIKTYCYDCSGESNREATFCGAVKCPLWEFRTGQRVGTKCYQARLEAAKRNYPEEYAEMEQYYPEWFRISTPCKPPSSKRRSVGAKSCQG